MNGNEANNQQFGMKAVVVIGKVAELSKNKNLETPPKTTKQRTKSSTKHRGISRKEKEVTI